MYYVAAPPEAGWRLDPVEFAGWLWEDWPGSSSTDPPEPVRAFTALEFSVALAGDELRGRLDAALNAVSVDAELPVFAAFALWLRDRAGAVDGLVACSETSGGIASLTSATTADEVVAALEY